MFVLRSGNSQVHFLDLIPDFFLKITNSGCVIIRKQRSFVFLAKIPFLIEKLGGASAKFLKNILVGN